MALEDIADDLDEAPPRRRRMAQSQEDFDKFHATPEYKKWERDMDEYKQTHPYRSRTPPHEWFQGAPSPPRPPWLPPESNSGAVSGARYASNEPGIPPSAGSALQGLSGQGPGGAGTRYAAQPLPRGYSRPPGRVGPAYRHGDISMGGETYPYGIGGQGHGAIPPGHYPINIGQGDIGKTGRRIGSIATVGQPGGVVDSPGHTFHGIQIHHAFSNNLDRMYSAGCIAVKPDRWPAFKQALLQQNAQTPGGLQINIDENYMASITDRHGQELMPAHARDPGNRPSPREIAHVANQSGQGQHGNNMLFLHGMQDRYQGTKPSELEDQARQVAQARGQQFHAIGGNAQEQLKQAQQYLRQNPNTDVLGFSQGGYTAAKLRQQFPNANYTILGAPKAQGDATIAGVGHMGQVGAWSQQALRQAQQRQEPTFQPAPPSTPGGAYAGGAPPDDRSIGVGGPQQADTQFMPPSGPLNVQRQGMPAFPDRQLAMPSQGGGPQAGTGGMPDPYGHEGPPRIPGTVQPPRGPTAGFSAPGGPAELLAGLSGAGPQTGDPRVGPASTFGNVPAGQERPPGPGGGPGGSIDQPSPQQPGGGFGGPGGPPGGFSFAPPTPQRPVTFGPQGGFAGPGGPPPVPQTGDMQRGPMPGPQGPPGGMAGPMAGFAGPSPFQFSGGPQGGAASPTGPGAQPAPQGPQFGTGGGPQFGTFARDDSPKGMSIQYPQPGLSGAGGGQGFPGGGGPPMPQPRPQMPTAGLPGASPQQGPVGGNPMHALAALSQSGRGPGVGPMGFPWLPQEMGGRRPMFGPPMGMGGMGMGGGGFAPAPFSGASAAPSGSAGSGSRGVGPFGIPWMPWEHPLDRAPPRGQHAAAEPGGQQYAKAETGTVTDAAPEQPEPPPADAPAEEHEKFAQERVAQATIENDGNWRKPGDHMWGANDAQHAVNYEMQTGAWRPTQKQSYQQRVQAYMQLIRERNQMIIQQHTQQRLDEAAEEKRLDAPGKRLKRELDIQEKQEKLAQKKKESTTYADLDEQGKKEIDLLAHSFFNIGPKAFANMARDEKWKESLARKRAEELHADLPPEKWDQHRQAFAATQRALNQGEERGRAMSQSAAMAARLLPQVREAMDALGDSISKYPTWNKLMAFLETQAGDPRWDDLRFTLKSVAYEYAQVLKANGRVAVSDVRNADEIIASVAGSSSIRVVLNRIVKEIQRGEQGINDVREQYGQEPIKFRNLDDLIEPIPGYPAKPSEGFGKGVPVEGQ